jgi:hypothetical protein
MLAFPRALSTALVCLSLLPGCGMAVYQPSKSATFELDAAREINDDDVKKAFEARPQLGDRLNVAYYSFDASQANDIEAMLTTVTGVASVYRLPQLLVTGEKRYQERHSWGPPPEVSVKKLRLLAARAHADVLLIFDYGHRTRAANGYIAFTPLLVPILFVPFLDNSVESYLEIHVIDTRNGYLYAQLTADEKGGDPTATIWASGTEPVIHDLWGKLLTSTRTRLGTLFQQHGAPTLAEPARAAVKAPGLAAGSP